MLISLWRFTLCCHAAIQACLIAWTYLHRSEKQLYALRASSAVPAPSGTVEDETKTSYLLSWAPAPTDTLVIPLRPIIDPDLFGAGHEELEALPEVNDTAPVPPVPVLQQTLGKSTAGFAGSEPSVPFKGRPPEPLARAFVRLHKTQSGGEAAAATTATAAPTAAPSSEVRASQTWGVGPSRSQVLGSLVPPTEAVRIATASPTPYPSVVRPLASCEHIAPAGPLYLEAAEPMPAAGGTYLDCMPPFTHYSGFAGIGAFAAAFKHVGGQCLGGFEWCSAAASAFEQLNPSVRLEGDFRQLDVAAVPGCDVYDAGAPCQSFSVAGRKAGLDTRGNLMFEQLSYLRQHRPLLGVFEQVPNFARLERGRLMQAFVEQLGAAGYVAHHQVMEARHFDACQHRERLAIVAVRSDLSRLLGDFCFPSPVTGIRPASTVLDPLFKYEGERYGPSSFVRCEPVHYDSGLIKVGSVHPHGRGCTVWDSKGLLPTQRCVGQGPAGATGLVLREGVVTQVTLEESALAQQMPEDWAADLQLTQEQIGNAVPLGIAYHLGVAIADYLRPHLLARAEIEKSEVIAPIASPPPRPHHLSKLSLREVRLGGFSRLAVRRIEWKRWSHLQRMQLLGALEDLRARRKATPRDLRLWRAAGLSAIANSHDGCSDELQHFEQHPVDLLWWQWRKHLWPMLRDGQRLPLQAEPDRCFKPNAPSAIHPNVDREFARLRRLGYLEGPYEAGSPNIKCVNAVLGVAKKDSPDKPRMCVNLTGSEVNSNLEFIKFLYPSFDDCADLVYPGCWMGKVDLTDGFFHRKVAIGSRKYLGIKLPDSGELMRYTVFPFGLSVSPHYFCAAISEVHRLLRQHSLFKGAPVINLPSCEGYDPSKPTVYQVTPSGSPTCAVAIYVDDAMVTAPTYGACQRALGVISRIFMRLGLREKRSKRDPPSRRCPFLGIELDSSNGSVTVRIPPSKLALIRAKIAVAVGAASETSAINRRLLASLVGLLSFFSRAVPASRAYLRRLYSCIHDVDRRHHVHDYDVDVDLPPEAKTDLLWWSEAMLRFRDAQVLRGVGAKVIRQHSDASGDGWGCTSEEYGSGSVDYNYGLFSPVLSAHTSNYRELLTVYAGIRRSRQLHPKGEHLNVIAYTDNSVSAACVNSGTSKSTELLPLVKEMGLYMVEHGITCKCVWIPGRQLIRQGADPLSRGAFPFEHFLPSRRGVFDPYHDTESNIPSFLQQLVETHTPPLRLVRHPEDWCHEQLEGCDLLLQPAPAATRSCLQHYFDAHRRHSESTSALALVACVASSDWFRLTRYFRDHVVVRYSPVGVKLVYPVLVALSPRLHLDHNDVTWWAALKARLLPLTVTPDL